jgi:hypothetical protein
MSGLGQKRRFDCLPTTSGLPRRTDIGGQTSVGRIRANNGPTSARNNERCRTTPILSLRERMGAMLRPL